MRRRAYEAQTLPPSDAAFPVARTDAGVEEALRRRTGGLSAFFAALVLLGASCAHRRPEVPSSPVALPEAFSRSGEAATELRWWEAFEDESLNHLMDAALDRNLSLKAAAQRLSQARAVARRQGAALAPSVDASASASRTAQRPNPTPGESGTAYANRFSVGLRISYLVDVWGKLRAARDAAEFAARASEADVRATALALTARVANTWYSLVEQRWQLEVLEQQAESSGRTLALVQMRYRNGSVPATDILQQRQQVESLRSERAGVKSAIASLSHQLAVLIGRVPKDAELPAGRGFAELPAFPETPPPASWVRQRPDLLAAHLRVRAQDREVAVALADRFPSLTLSASAESGVPTVSDLLDEWVASLVGSVAAPVFAGGRRRAEIDRTRAALSESLHNYAQTLLDALKEVEDALAAEQAQRVALESIERQEELAGQTLRQMRGRYRNGAVSFVEVLAAEQSHQRLQRNRLAARRALIARRIDLVAALGRGWDRLPNEQSRGEN